MSKEDRDPMLSGWAQIIRRPLMMSELRTLIDFLPRIDRNEHEVTSSSDSEARKFVGITLIHDVEFGGWRVPSINVYTDEHFDIIIMTAAGCPSMIRTQRGKSKVYKTIDAVVSDFRNVLPDESVLHISV